MIVDVAGLPREKKGSFCNTCQIFYTGSYFSENAADRMLQRIVQRVLIVREALAHQLHRIHLGKYI